MRSPTLYLAKDGYKGLLFFLFLFFLGLILGFKALSFFAFCLCVLWAILFRDPERHPYSFEENAFLSPVDGKVIDLVFRENKVLMTIKVDVLDVGVLRAPINIDEYRLSKISGSPLYFSSKKALLCPQITMKFEKYAMKITQNLFRFLPIEAKASFRQGQKMGFLKAGEIELALEDIEVKVDVGQQLKSGESVIGYMQ